MPKRPCVLCSAALALATLLALAGGRLLAAETSNPLQLHLRSRVETEKGSGRYHTLVNEKQWDPKKTALIVCDMWDKHWCEASTTRVGEMAPRMNEVVKAARARGVFIIHAPSDTMKFYENTPQRKLAQAAPKVTPPVPLQRWNRIDPRREPPLPIDDSDGGCDSGSPMGNPWTRQIATIEVVDGDAVTDSEEAYYLLQQRGIDNVIVMGVHTNMCVLGRPFSIRQMVSQGKNVVLMRDMTDTMYNPARRPYVSHFTGTDLVVEHIEKYWCPSITSADLLGGQPFRFSGDRRPHLVVVMAEVEYRAKETLPKFALQYLGQDFRVSYVFASEKDPNDLPGIEVLREADVALLAMHRRAPSKQQLAVIRSYLAAGKPLAAIRTTSHALAAEPKDADHAGWPAFDREILGCFYQGHHNNKEADGPKTYVWTEPAAQSHPVLTRVPAGEFHVPSWLYKSLPLAGGCTTLMTGRVEDRKPHEPVAWTRTRPDGGRMFYTSLGSPEDLELYAVRRLLFNGIMWAAGLPVPSVIAEDEYPTDWVAMKVPGTWDDNSGGKLGRYDGFAWYRALVKVPARWKGRELKLNLGNIDDCDVTFVNGTQVGATGAVPPAEYQPATATSRSYTVPAALVKPDDYNLIAIRVYDGSGAGGFKSGGQSIAAGDEAIKLEGAWQFHLGDDASWAKAKLEAETAKKTGALFVGE